MTLVSRLTIPALIGGIIALAATGLFSPQVRASWTQYETIAQVSGVPAHRVLNLRAAPSAEAELTGTIARNAFIWVENCTGVMGEDGWCLVERGGEKGWVAARYLTLHTD